MARLVDVVKDAVEKQDLKTIEKIVDYCRFKLSLDYMGTYNIFKTATGMDLDDYEEIMYDLDTNPELREA